MYVVIWEWPAPCRECCAEQQPLGPLEWLTRHLACPTAAPYMEQRQVRCCTLACVDAAVRSKRAVLCAATPLCVWMQQCAVRGLSRVPQPDFDGGFQTRTSMCQAFGMSRVSCSQGLFHSSVRTAGTCVQWQVCCGLCIAFGWWSWCWYFERTRWIRAPAGCAACSHSGMTSTWLIQGQV